MSAMVEAISAVLDGHEFAGVRQAPSYTGCNMDNWGGIGVTQHDFNLHVAEAIAEVVQVQKVAPGYPDKYPACIMCGAKPGDPCDTISEPGTPRKYPHAARSKPGTPGPTGPFVAVRDEGEYRS